MLQFFEKETTGELDYQITPWKFAKNQKRFSKPLIGPEVPVWWKNRGKKSLDTVSFTYHRESMVDRVAWYRQNLKMHWWMSKLKQTDTEKALLPVYHDTGIEKS